MPTLTRFYLIATLLAATNVAAAQVVPTGSEKPPAGKAIVGMFGSPMAKLFATFGPPTDVTPQGKKNPLVRMDYGDFAFSMRNKQVIECYVWSQLPGDSGVGFNFGDTLDDVTKRLGKAKQTVTNKDGSGEADFNSPDNSRIYRMIFDPSKKCIGYGVLTSD